MSIYKEKPKTGGWVKVAGGAHQRTQVRGVRFTFLDLYKLDQAGLVPMHIFSTNIPLLFLDNGTYAPNSKTISHFVNLKQKSKEELIKLKQAARVLRSIT